MHIHTTISSASFSVRHKFDEEGRHAGSGATYSVWLVGVPSRHITLQTGEDFTSPPPRKANWRPGPNDIRIGLDIYPASDPPPDLSNFIAYEEGYGSGSERVHSWIGGMVTLPDDDFAELMANARHSNYPKTMLIVTEKQPFLKYGHGGVCWDNVSDPDNKLIPISRLEYSFVLLDSTA